MPFSSAHIMSGTLADGSLYEARCPSSWNGYLVVQPDLWRTPHEDGVETWLFEQGYASLRHSRDIRKWNLSRGLANQEEALTLFDERFGVPSTGIIAAGASLSGLLTRVLIEKTPDRYAGAIPMDGGGGGVLAPFERGLDMAFVLATLLGDESQHRSDSAGPADAAARIRDTIQSATATPLGRARVALAAAVGMMPVWNDPALPRPDSGDPEAEIEHLARGVASTLPSALEFRAFLDALMGGAVCGNEAVDYTRILTRSGGFDRVQALYDRAGGGLWDDLSALEAAPRVTADAEARAGLLNDGHLAGAIRCPTLILKGIGDPDAVASEETAYRDTLLAGGTADLARVAWVDTAGHVNFTVAERVTAVVTLVDRIETGRWSDSMTPIVLNRRAQALAKASDDDLTLTRLPTPASESDPALSRFVSFVPPPLSRSLPRSPPAR